jgi:hypothetical protein
VGEDVGRERGGRRGRERSVWRREVKIVSALTREEGLVSEKQEKG